MVDDDVAGWTRGNFKLPNLGSQARKCRRRSRMGDFLKMRKCQAAAALQCGSGSLARAEGARSGGPEAGRGRRRRRGRRGRRRDGGNGSVGVSGSGSGTAGRNFWAGGRCTVRCGALLLCLLCKVLRPYKTRTLLPSTLYPPPSTLSLHSTFYLVLHSLPCRPAESSIPNPTTRPTSAASHRHLFPHSAMSAAQLLNPKAESRVPFTPPPPISLVLYTP